ncbi:MAG: hypothetical protein Q7R86_02340 [bacterium]|nr:hypothetical protein [bacterium]
MLQTTSYIKKDGQAAISMIFLIGGTILLIGVTLAFLIFSFITSAFGFKAANQALGIALGGANDALLRISSNRGYPNLGCEEYTFTIDDYSALVKVQRSWGDPQYANQDDPCFNFQSPPILGLATIESEAAVFGRKRRVYMIVSISPDGQVNVVSVRQEIISSGGLSQET